MVVIYFQEMKVDWGLRTAKKWFNLEWNKSLYLHDANTSTFVHYCFAYDLKRVAEEGLFYLPNHEVPEPESEMRMRLPRRAKTAALEKSKLNLAQFLNEDTS